MAQGRGLSAHEEHEVNELLSNKEQKWDRINEIREQRESERERAEVRPEWFNSIHTQDTGAPMRQLVETERSARSAQIRSWPTSLADLMGKGTAANFAGTAS